MIHKEQSPMARKNKQQQPAQRQPDDDVEKGIGPDRDPDIENPAEDPDKKSNRGDGQQEIPSGDDQDERDEPEK
jgi:hypothetical protein